MAIMWCSPRIHQNNHPPKSSSYSISIGYLPQSLLLLHLLSPLEMTSNPYGTSPNSYPTTLINIINMEYEPFYLTRAS